MLGVILGSSLVSASPIGMFEELEGKRGKLSSNLAFC
jgi:hypothetical protein